MLSHYFLSCFSFHNLLSPVSFSAYDFFFFFQAEDGIRDAQESRGLGDVYKRQDSIGDGGYRKLWAIGLILCNAVFFYWIMIGLKATMADLVATQQSAKFKMYTNMSWALAVFIGIWVVYGLILVVLSVFGVFETHVHTVLMGSLWPIVYFMFLMTLSYIWRPTAKSYMLAMSYEICSDEISPEIELDSAADCPADIGASSIQETNKMRAVVLNRNVPGDHSNMGAPNGATDEQNRPHDWQSGMTDPIDISEVPRDI
eukprot:TRINITY_DN9136_c0_g1_i1.p1 TRINITY_DN9136_c0_g1~~TRINITY_DN9136_c0_g1_i1.p1  ORF type:complete len:257 (+),score=49.53 TRINITY_DN9136_c0_g1_i1:47-817(+)